MTSFGDGRRQMRFSQPRAAHQQQVDAFRTDLLRRRLATHDNGLHIFALGDAVDGTRGRRRIIAQFKGIEALTGQHLAQPAFVVQIRIVLPAHAGADATPS